MAPQPLESVMTVSVTNNTGDAQFIVYDISGKSVHKVQLNGNQQFTINKGRLAAGMYAYKLINRAGKLLASGKLMVR
ncbi:MAG: T9SS type A sorting domain-containing protein [Chitinophagaceae bacterium]|nr:MAG: T9SS type A sorting domain-containing protein [Chitinophagaceae bacterium]